MYLGGRARDADDRDLACHLAERPCGRVTPLARHEPAVDQDFVAVHARERRKKKANGLSLGKRCAHGPDKVGTHTGLTRSGVMTCTPSLPLCVRGPT